MHSRHGVDFLAYLCARAHEHRIDQSTGRKPRLAHQSAQRFASPQSPWPLSREAHSSFAPTADRLFVRAKCPSNASTTAFVVVSVARAIRCIPALLKALDVVCPIATITTLPCNVPNLSGPASSTKFCTALGL